MGIALKGKRMPFSSRMVAGKSGDRLSWMIEQGLTWRGTRPEGWRPKPKSFKAWVYLIFVMLPRGVFK